MEGRYGLKKTAKRGRKEGGKDGRKGRSRRYQA